MSDVNDELLTPARPVTEAADLRDLHTRLLQPAFPADELATADWLCDAVASGQASVLMSEDCSGPVATAVTERLGTSGSVLLSYFATRADRRGRGVGSHLFAQMLDAVRLLERPRLLVAEVERPDRHTGSADHGDPTARLRFYGRQGARALDLPYFQPPIHDGSDAVHGMLLLALWVDPALVTSGPDGSSLPGAGLVGDAVDAILEAPKPGESAEAEEPAEAAALRAAAGAERVRLHDVEGYRAIASSR